MDFSIFTKTQFLENSVTPKRNLVSIGNHISFPHIPFPYPCLNKPLYFCLYRCQILNILL